MRLPITSVLAFAMAGSAFAGPGVSPASVKKDADPGTSFNIEKVVTTPEILPKPDIVLLVDVTLSMGGAIDNIKTNLRSVITTVKNQQPNAQFAVVSFGDLRDPNAFKVVKDLTNDEAALQSAVESLTPQFGQDTDEDWINALWQISNGAVTFRTGSSRIIVLVGDAPSHDPSGGHSLTDTITALLGKIIRVIGVNVSGLDGKGQATAVTTATSGVIIGSAANDVTKAIVSGLKNLDVTVKPDVVSCDSGLALVFTPAQTTVRSGATVTFNEKVNVAEGAKQGRTHRCSVRFLLNGTPGGEAFIQSVNVTVNRLGCNTCNPQPGKNLCHITTSCAPTPYGTMCLTRPGFKADGAGDSDLKTQWRIEWPGPGHEHRVAVKPGTSANTLCDPKNKGPDVCKEVKIGDCATDAVVFDGVRQGADQNVMGGGEL